MWIHPCPNRCAWRFFIIGVGKPSAGFRLSSLEEQSRHLNRVKLGGSEAVVCMNN